MRHREVVEVVEEKKNLVEMEGRLKRSRSRTDMSHFSIARQFLFSFADADMMLFLPQLDMEICSLYILISPFLIYL